MALSKVLPSFKHGYKHATSTLQARYKHATSTLQACYKQSTSTLTGARKRATSKPQARRRQATSEFHAVNLMKHLLYFSCVWRLRSAPRVRWMLMMRLTAAPARPLIERLLDRVAKARLYLAAELPPHKATQCPSEPLPNTLAGCAHPNILQVRSARDRGRSRYGRG